MRYITPSPLYFSQMNSRIAVISIAMDNEKNIIAIIIFLVLSSNEVIGVQSNKNKAKP